MSRLAVPMTERSTVSACQAVYADSRLRLRTK